MQRAKSVAGKGEVARTFDFGKSEKNCAPAPAVTRENEKYTFPEWHQIFAESCWEAEIDETVCWKLTLIFYTIPIFQPKTGWNHSISGHIRVKKALRNCVDVKMGWIFVRTEKCRFLKGLKKRTQGLPPSWPYSLAWELSGKRPTGWKINALEAHRNRSWE